MNKKIFILLSFILFFSALLLSGKVVEDFEHFNISQVSTTGISNVFLSAYYYSSSGYSLSVERNIGVAPQCEGSSSLWTVANEIVIIPSEKNWSGGRYFGIWINDMANLNGNGASSYQISFYDGDEEWIHEVGFSDYGWHHVVIYLKDTGWGTKYYDNCSLSTQYSSDSAGFSLPKWETEDAYYIGNGVVDLNNVQKVKIAFGKATPVTGECLIDNIRVFNEVKKFSPVLYEGYRSYLAADPHALSLEFVEDMQKPSVLSALTLYTNGDSVSNSVPASISYDENTRTASIVPASGFKTNMLYKIVMDRNLIFASGLPIIRNITNEFIIKTNISLGKDSGTIVFNNGFVINLKTDTFNQNYPFKSYSVIPGSIPGTSVKSLLEYKITPVVSVDSLSNISYSADISSLSGVDYANLKVYYKEGNSYQEIPAQVDEDTKFVRFSYDKTGDFVIGEVETAVGIRNDLVKVTAVENKIFNPDNNEYVSINLSIGNGVSQVLYEIYTASGRLVYSSSHSVQSSLVFQWDGCDNALRKLESGIYIVKITVSSGNDDVEEFYGWNENKGQSQTVKVPVVLYK